MAPRKRNSSSSASTRKPNQSQCQQPSKFGIQHFFERHSQSQAAVSNPQDPNPNPKPSHSTPPHVDPLQRSIATATGTEDEASSQISPEISKSAVSKRFKFSPGMLIKQSQDDGGEEITWKISPVNERLRSIAEKQLSGISRMFSDALRPSAASSLHRCSQKQNTSLDGKMEKCLSSSAMMASDKTLVSSRKPLASIQEKEACSSHERTMDGLQSPFRTPPSISYGHSESLGCVACDGASEDIGSRQHRKALLELLDQVEDAITEETLPNNSMVCSSQNGSMLNVQPDPTESTALYTIPERVDGSSCDETFLVLEVTEKHSSINSLNTVKILRILKEQTGQERALHLCDEWLYTPIVPGDTVNVIGEFDQHGICVVDHENNLLVVHPDILVSGTRVASSFTCPRRAVLDERLKCTEHSMSALLGTLLHQIFQAGLLKELPTHRFLEEYARIVLQKNLEGLYACGADEQNIYSKLIEAIPRILSWLGCFKDAKETKPASIDFGYRDEQKSVSITEVIDIEEMAWAPRYGLKGMIDASVHVKISSSSGSPHEKIMPLEFKTGKATTGQSAMEHRAQVILYTLLMCERYLKKDIDSGLLYYLHTDQTSGIKVQRSDLVGLIMRRNELATDILKASTLQTLPPMLRNMSMCKDCRHLSSCTLYHKAHGGSTDNSGLGDLFESHVRHLTSNQSGFLKHWEHMIDLEAKTSQMAKKEILRPHISTGEHCNNRLTSVVLDVTSGCDSSINGRFIYHFVHEKQSCNSHVMPRGEKLDFLEHGVRKSDCTLRCGDYVILSTESGRIAVASGIVSDINQVRVSVSMTRRLRLPGSDPSIGLAALSQVVWRLDKDEFSSSYAIMRYSLIQLFLQGPRSFHLRKMIVDLEAPRFDSGGIFSQDPAISYIHSERNLNDDQRRAIHKILSAKDYTLILGMPGTGKTSTMVHAVKALLRRGSSILLTSYTNSAVDNLLIKLKAQGIEFIRIGRLEAVHDDIRGNCFSALEVQTVDKIKQKMENVRVVGVTCLGINHPLLANKRFDICIMDEAGQITLPVSLGPLMLASTFVLVGDHYQLPPLVQSAEARENGMGVSLFCRLSEAHPQAISALQCQYRMCTAIMELSNALIYGNRLRCGSSEVANAKLKLSGGESGSLWLNEVLDPNKPVVFTNTDLLPAQETRERKTVKNSLEAYIVSEITRELMKKGIGSDDIGVITPYNSQADLIRCVLDACVEIHTIDKYQGRDKDCILVSFVRSSENPRACNSSLLGDWHRINVVLTRAKKKLIMVGSCKTLSRVPLLKLLIEKVDVQGGLVYISNKDICRFKDLKKCSQTV